MQNEVVHRERQRNVYLNKTEILIFNIVHKKKENQNSGFMCNDPRRPQPRKKS